MANIKSFTLAEIENKGSAKVGNNRVVEYIKKDDVFVGKLHGSSVFEFARSDNKICIDFCGYATATTGAAINDFLSAFGYGGRVSRKGEKVTFQLGGVEVKGDINNPITISF